MNSRSIFRPSHLWVEGDSTRLEQIVSNLLNNAAKYTEPGGRITITLGHEADQAVLTVQDTGIGMTPELQDAHLRSLRASRPFSRSRAGGLGIGLTLVRSLVELHGGTVSVSSPGPGQGSEFKVRLPLIEDAVIPPMKAAAVFDEVTWLAVFESWSWTITATPLARWRKSWSWTAMTSFCAYDGLSVIEQVAAHQPEVVLLDIGLPGIDGYQVAEQLRQRYPNGRPHVDRRDGIRRRT